MKSRHAHTLDFDNSKLLDINLISCDHRLKLIGAHIANELFSNERHISRDKILTILDMVLANLYRNWSIDKHLFTSYSRNNNNYIKVTSRYNSRNINTKHLLHVIDALIDHKYIESKIGIYYEYCKRKSRVIAAQPLIELFNKIDSGIVKKNADTETIWVRNTNKKNIDYDDDSFTNHSRAIVESYNQLLQSSSIEMNGEVLQQQFVHRVFNLSDTGRQYLGGRFYGGDWMNQNSVIRKTIKIDDKNTSELDYESHHIRMLYNIADLNLEHDPYNIPFLDLNRNLTKQFMLTMINSKNKTAAIKSITCKNNKSIVKKKHGKTLTKRDSLFLSIPNVKETFQLITCFHVSIADQFFNSVGIKLQLEDSQLTELILEHFTRKGILVLPIHDSYVINSKYADELREVMIHVYKKRFNFNPTISTKH